MTRQYYIEARHLYLSQRRFQRKVMHLSNVAAQWARVERFHTIMAMVKLRKGFYA